MKILHVISSGGMYGAEAVILDLSRCLERSGHRSLLGVFANSAQPHTELAVRAQAEGLETHLIPCRGQLDLSLPARLAELAKATGADVVHAHGYKADIYTYWALRRSRIPLVSTCHNWLDNDIALRLYGSLDRRILRGFQKVIAVSDGVQNRLLSSGMPPEKVQLIRNGVDLLPFAGIHRSQAPASPEAPLTIGIVARLSSEKGVDLFIRAAAIVLEKFPEARFLIAGDGPDRAALQALIEELRVADRVRLCGRQEDMPAFYASLDLLVLSSRTEGLPMALLEGMASALPVVAAEVGEVPTVIQDGRTGLIVPTENPGALAAAISEMLQNPARRHSMGADARARVADDFSVERMLTQHLCLYGDAISIKSQRSI